MRLVTWNACKGQFASKAHYLDHLHADVAVIQEIARPVEPRSNVIWFGANVNQGVAVVTRPPFLPRHTRQFDGVPRYVLPVEIEGPRSFLLFAVWTLGEEPYPYVCAASSAIDAYAPLFSGRDVVMLGDFNSNANWDREHPAALNHSSMVDRLDRLGLVSAYHHFYGQRHGEETTHTFYLHWSDSKKYHIDYCFIPKSWAPKLRAVEIGSFVAWQRASDHRPMLVDLGDA